MPLPESGDTPWPPKALDGISGALEQWSAWYGGDPGVLRSTYRNVGAERARVRPSQLSGGVLGSVARWFWGSPVTLGQSRESQLHVPIASDLCQASADLLFAEPPSMTVDEGKGESTPVGDRLTELVDDGMLTTFAEAAEVGAALGGSFLRVTWAKQLGERPFLSALPLDAAWPEFLHGRLVACTFWWLLSADANGGRYVRHLERHETRDGIGVIEHALYEGRVDNLGTRVPLAEHPSTEDLEIDAQSIITTGTPGLAVVHIPNQRPQRRWRSHPLGSSYGRSDLDGVESLMDALDEVYSSWMRDIRLGKARLMVPGFMLDTITKTDSNGNRLPGGGAYFDPDREIYSEFQAPPNSTAAVISAHQFKIRHEEHRSTAQQLVEDILRTAGYSAATFGEGPEGMQTATEVVSRERRSFMTRDRKIRLQTPALETIVEKLLAVDAALFGGPGVLPVNVDFADGVQDSPIVLAQTAQALRTAEAASTKTLVALNHPSWDVTQIDDEVKAILGERPDAPASPFGPEPDLQPVA